MKTIWKYQLEIIGEQSLPMPRGAKLLSLQTQGEIPVMWALVDTSENEELRVFSVYGPGHQVHDNPEDYVGSFQMHDGNLVFHVFEVRR